jgi:hypothetical protein
LVSRRHSYPTAILSAGLGLIAMLGIGAATAQDSGGARTAGPIVEIVGSGGEIEAVGASVVITGSASRVQAAGARVEINATVTGPLRAAGAEVTIAGSVAGDLRAGGGLVEVTGRYGGEVYLGAAVIRFDAVAARDVNLGAATVTVGPAAEIAGQLSVAGADVTVAGKTTGTVRLGGAAVTFNGAAAGNVIADAGQVVIGSTATIGGDLIVRSRAAPIIAEGAAIAGKVVIEEPSRWSRIPVWLWKGLFALFMAAGAVVTGIVLLIFGRSAFEEGVAHAAFRPLSSGLIGLATLILLPIVAAILMASVVGLTIGLAVLLLLPFLLVAGHAVVAACIGIWIFDRSGGPRGAGRLVVFTIAGAIVIAVVWLIPWAGPIVAFLAMLVGIGAYVRSLGARLRRRLTAPA